MKRAFLPAPTGKGSHLTDLEEFRKFLGPLADDYIDAQLEQLRYEMFSLADLLIDVYLAGKREPRKNTRCSL